MFRRNPLLTMLAALTLVLAACQAQPSVPTPAAAPAATPAAKPAATPADQPQRGGSLRVGIYADAGRLDPHNSLSKNDVQVFRLVFDRLVEWDNQLIPGPGLAESWESPDQKTWTFKLRKGVKFHDGTPFNAEAVKVNADRIMNPDNKLKVRADLIDLESVTVVDDATVRFQLKSPQVSFLDVMADDAGTIISPAALKKYDKDIGRNPIGTGPFRMTEWVKDDHLTFKRNEDYWTPGRPYLDEVVFKVIPDDSVRLTNLRAGGVDFVDNVAPKDGAALRQNPELVYKEVPTLNWVMIRLQTQKPPFNNKALRQAFAWGIDREIINKTLYFGLGAVSQGPLSPLTWAHDPNLKGYTRDLAKVKEKLAEGGQPSGFKFTMDTRPEPIYVQLAQVLKQQLAEAGIDMTINVLELNKLLENTDSGNYDASISFRTGRPDPGLVLQGDYYTKGRYNRMQYSNKQLDEILDKARATANKEERKTLYYQAERIVVEDQPQIFIQFLAMGQAWTPKVQGYIMLPNDIMRFANVWLKK